MRSRICVWFVLSVFIVSAHAEEQSWRSLINQGNAAFGQHKLDDALQLFDQSLQATGGVPEFVALSNHDIGMVLQTRGDYKRAEPFYQRSMENWEKAETRPLDLMAATYNNFGDLLNDK